MTDTTTTSTVAPEAPAATPPSPQSTDDTHGETVYRTQEQFDRALGARLERERAKLANDRQSAIDAAKQEATTEVTKSFQTKLVSTSAKSIARDLKFHDVTDALAAIDPEKLPIKDGEVDDAALKAALEELLTKKPYLAAPSEDPKPGKKTSTTRPKLPEGNPDPKDGEPKKRTAAEALRELAAQKHR